MSSLDYLDLCRLCLVKESVSVPIFDGEGDARQIFLKIAACLPVKVARDDKLPKKICNDCVYKVELFYQFWNTTSNAEKQLMEWIGEVDLNDKQTYVSAVMNQNQSSENVLQQTNNHQNNMEINMMDSMGLEMPMIISQDQTHMSMNNTSVQQQTQDNNKEIENSDDDNCGDNCDDNCDDDMDNDEGLPVKEEIIQDSSNRTIEPPTFVNVSIPCDEAGPSGLQQKSEIPDMMIAGQSGDEDVKSGKRKRGRPLDRSKSPINFIVVNVPGRKKGRPKKSTGQLKSAVTKKLCQDPIAITNNFRKTTLHRRAKVELNSKTVIDEKITIKEEISENNLLIPIKKRVMPNRNSNLLTIKKNKNQDDLESDEDDNNNNNDDDDDDEKQQEKVQSENKNEIKEKKYICSLCDAKFDLSSKYKQHMYKHYASKTFECDYCHKKFKTRAIIKTHMRNQHEEIRTYYCDECSFETKYPTTIKTHKHRKHRTSNDPQFTCDYCKKKFFMKPDWETHVKNIHESGPQTCEICGLVCPSKNSLLGHKNYRHKEKNFPCPKCNKKLITAENLAAHIVQHDLIFVCEICGMQFKKKSGLKKHESVHMDKKFTCTRDGCDKKFTTIMTLRVHLLTHKGVKPYTCNVCPKSFTQRSSLMHHWKRAHHDTATPPPAVHLRNIVDS